MRISGKMSTLSTSDVVKKLAKLEAQMQTTLEAWESFDKDTATKIENLVEQKQLFKNTCAHNLNDGDRIDGLELAVAELSDLNAQKHADLESKLHCELHKRDAVVHNLARRMSECPTDDRIKDLIMGTLEASLTPLAQFVAQKMAEIPNLASIQHGNEVCPHDRSVPD